MDMYHQSNPNLIKLRRYLIVIFILIIISLLSFFLYNLRFHIVRFNPDLKSISIITPKIEVDTNKILSKDIKVDIDGNALKNFEIVDKKIIINLNTSLDQKQYTITIYNFKDTSGDSMSLQKIKFTPTIKNVSNLTISSNPEAFQPMSNYDTFLSNNPVLGLLPYTGQNFEYLITYDINNESIIFNIYYDSPQGKLDALNFLSVQNVDVGKSIINYIYGPVP